MKPQYKDGKELKHMTCKASFKEAGEGEGIIEAYVSIFGNVDSYNEIVDKGAFTESLARKLPKGVWCHDWNQPIAVTLEAKEDDTGLLIKAQLVKGVQRADEAYLLMKAGAIDEFSIGYTVASDEMDAQGVRHLKKVNLYEWSPVLVGANPETFVVGVKSAEEEAVEDDTVEAEEDGEVDEEPTEDADADEVVEAPAGEDTQPKPQTDENQEATEEAQPDEGEGKSVKAGAELSAENRALLQGVVDALKDLGSAIKSAQAPIESLLEKTAKGQKVETESPSNTVKVLRVRQIAKSLDRKAEQIIRILKN